MAESVLKRSADQKKIVILAADDRTVRELLSELLSDLGCEVRAADDPDSLFSAELDRGALCFILDLDSGRNDWLKVALALRRDPSLSHVPILFLSDDGARGIQVFVNASRLGPNSVEYLSKPVSPRELAFHIGRLSSDRVPLKDPDSAA